MGCCIYLNVTCLVQFTSYLIGFPWVSYLCQVCTVYLSTVYFYVHLLLKLFITCILTIFYLLFYLCLVSVGGLSSQIGIVIVYLFYFNLLHFSYLPCNLPLTLPLTGTLYFLLIHFVLYLFSPCIVFVTLLFINTLCSICLLCIFSYVTLYLFRLHCFVVTFMLLCYSVSFVGVVCIYFFGYFVCHFCCLSTLCINFMFSCISCSVSTYLFLDCVFQFKHLYSLFTLYWSYVTLYLLFLFVYLCC